MENKYCEYCSKPTVFISDANGLYDNILIFCNKQCKNKFIAEYIQDNIWEIIRNNIDTAKEIVLN